MGPTLRSVKWWRLNLLLAHLGLLHISHDRLHRYVNEFAGRHNIRSMNTAGMMDVVTENIAGQRLKYFDLFNV